MANSPPGRKIISASDPAPSASAGLEIWPAKLMGSALMIAGMALDVRHTINSRQCDPYIGSWRRPRGAGACGQGPCRTRPATQFRFEKETAMPASEIVIASAKRTPVGSFNGALGSTPAHDLGAVAIKSALEAAKVEAGQVDEVILGQILSAAQGQNPARQAAMKAGVPQEKTAFGVNQLCGSGLRAVALGMQQIAGGDAHIIVAGGQESMSMAPHAAYLRSGVKMGEMKLVDTMLQDGLIDAFHGYHMGNTAENIARKWQITREEQDRFAVGSQNKAEAAQKAGRFKDEIAPVTVKTRKGDVVVDADEYPRAGSTYDAMAKLKPAFSKDGTVTAGNASGLNDG